MPTSWFPKHIIYSKLGPFVFLQYNLDWGFVCTGAEGVLVSGAYALFPRRFPEVFSLHLDGERRCSISGSSGGRERRRPGRDIAHVYRSWLEPVKS